MAPPFPDAVGTLVMEKAGRSPVCTKTEKVAPRRATSCPPALAAQHVDQHDVGQELRNVDGVEILPAGQVAVVAALGPIAIASLQHRTRQLGLVLDPETETFDNRIHTQSPELLQHPCKRTRTRFLRAFFNLVYGESGRSRIIPLGPPGSIARFLVLVIIGIIKAR